ncbi:hypothetical protein CVS48_29135 [Achromobacter spanius]|nr:hypothetical protein CVS48_29135 [Achromobacter spanius]
MGTLEVEMEALATHACGAANSKYHCGRMAGEVTRTIRLNAPVSDRQTAQEVEFTALRQR